MSDRLTGILILVAILYPIILSISIQMAKELREDDSVYQFFKVIFYFILYTPLNVPFIFCAILMTPFIDPITKSIEKKKLRKIKEKRIKNTKYLTIDPYEEENWEE